MKKVMCLDMYDLRSLSRWWVVLTLAKVPPFLAPTEGTRKVPKTWGKRGSTVVNLST